MLRVVVVAIGIAGCGAPHFLLRYRLHEGDRFYTETRTANAKVRIVLRARTEVGRGLRLHNEIVALSTRLDGVPVDGRALAADVAEQRVMPDRRRVVTIDGETTPFGAGMTRLPARAVRIGSSWEERRSRSGTSLWMRETLVGLEGSMGVVALRGVIRTELAPTETGLPRAVVSRIAGRRRIDLASAWVGQTELEIVTSVQVGALQGRAERSRIVLRVSREPFEDTLSE